MESIENHHQKHLLYHTSSKFFAIFTRNRVDVEKIREFFICWAMINSMDDEDFDD